MDQLEKQVVDLTKEREESPQPFVDEGIILSDADEPILQDFQEPITEVVKRKRSKIAPDDDKLAMEHKKKKHSRISDEELIGKKHKKKKHLFDKESTKAKSAEPEPNTPPPSGTVLTVETPETPPQDLFEKVDKKLGTKGKLPKKKVLAFWEIILWGNQDETTPTGRLDKIRFLLREKRLNGPEIQEAITKLRAITKGKTARSQSTEVLNELLKSNQLTEHNKVFVKDRLDHFNSMKN